MVDPVVHFEIPADNPARAKKFYEKTFGWKIDFIKEFDYYGIKAKKDQLGIDGGMMKRKMPGQPFMVYIYVASIDAALKKAQANGATVAMPKTPIGDMGAIAAFTDPEGNLIGLHEMAQKESGKKEKKKEVVA